MGFPSLSRAPTITLQHKHQVYEIHRVPARWDLRVTACLPLSIDSSRTPSPVWHSGGRRFDPDRLHQASFETAFRTTPGQARVLTNAVSDGACHGVARRAKPDPAKPTPNNDPDLTFGCSRASRGVPSRCAGVPTPTTHPLRPPLACAVATPFGKAVASALSECQNTIG